jgi:hypothetical protein
MWVTGYAYPWDVTADPGFADRAAALGVDEIAVATSYHTARAATPWLTGRSSVLAAHAAFYRPVREAAWEGQQLRPAEPGWVTSADSAGDAVRSARESGFRTALWVVLTHNTLLGTASPVSSAVDCFGQPHPWALCPAREEVRDYAATIAAESVRDLDPDSVILESCGPMGAVHQHMHEKTDGVWSPAVARLLSVCCCAACADNWRAIGLDPAETVGVLAERVRAIIDSGDLAIADDGLPSHIRDGVLLARQRATDALRHQVLAAIAEAGTAGRIVLHGSPDPWATGALPGLTPSAGDEVDSVVVQCWQPGTAALDTVRATRAHLPSTVDVGAYVTAVAANPVADMAGYVRHLHTAGAAELHLYHLGLAGPGRLPYLRDAITTAHQPPCAPTAFPMTTPTTLAAPAPLRTLA